MRIGKKDECRGTNKKKGRSSELGYVDGGKDERTHHARKKKKKKGFTFRNGGVEMEGGSS